MKFDCDGPGGEDCPYNGLVFDADGRPILGARKGNTETGEVEEFVPHPDGGFLMDRRGFATQGLQSRVVFYKAPLALKPLPPNFNSTAYGKAFYADRARPLDDSEVVPNVVTYAK